jgi:hypothetical protein
MGTNATKHVFIMKLQFIFTNVTKISCFISTQLTSVDGWQKVTSRKMHQTKISQAISINSNNFQMYLKTRMLPKMFIMKIQLIFITNEA